MKKLLTLMTLSLMITNTYASTSQFLDFGNSDYETRKSNWIFNVEYSNFETPVIFPAYDGVHFDLDGKQENFESSGLGLSWGGNIHLFSGLSTTLKLGGMLHKNLTETEGKAAKNIDINMANEVQNFQVGALEASMSLNYIYETSVINIQPFVEVAQGRGMGEYEQNYNFKASKLDSAKQDESYDMTLSQNFQYQRASIGINFINAIGISSYFKVSKSQVTTLDRKIEGSYKTTTSALQNVKEEQKNLNQKGEITSMSLGIGFLF